MLDSVSNHAVIRYLERVLGLPVAQWLWGCDMLDEDIRAEMCCQRAGLPVAAVKQAILIKPVLAAIMAGFEQVIVRHDGFAYVVRSGKLVTILTERMRDQKTGNGEKLKVAARKSHRREIIKSNRRHKDRLKNRNRRRMEEV